MTERLHICVRGAVQGVGFRPFVYRLALEMKLNGWVMNSSEGVFIEVEGSKLPLEKFLIRLKAEKPPRSSIHSLEHSYLDPRGYERFEIRKSENSGETSALILPDIATCQDCLSDITDPRNRRFGYPFTNCTNCGPRFSIIEGLPYDREQTSMKLFKMCPECRAEYDDPLDRRFHAQPNACPLCGPRLELWDKKGEAICSGNAALESAADRILAGDVVALKGIGGFQFIVDARNEGAVNRLRNKKHREEKPFALLYPSLEAIRLDCVITGVEESLLLSPEAPIVLLKKNKGNPHLGWQLADSVAPGNPHLGIMLPCTPLHHLLTRKLQVPIVATSGNYSDEPICVDEKVAVKKFSAIVDYYLVHDRPIVRHIDDSIVRIIAGREMVTRRARGYAPLPVNLENPGGRTAIAVGAHLKNSVALQTGGNVFISQHIGDLESAEAYSTFHEVIKSFKDLYRTNPDHIISDLHPDYLSTEYAAKAGARHSQVQHHYAHCMSCVAENQIKGNVLGVAWDGSGYGTDGTVWGGEFLAVGSSSFSRVATFRQFRLPGGDAAVKEPRRTAIGMLFELFGLGVADIDDLPPVRSFSRGELQNITLMLKNGINSPVTSSAGRIFDAVSSLAGLSQKSSFEGQPAMLLEWAIGDLDSEDRYPFTVNESRPAHRDEFSRDPLNVIDWSSMMTGIVGDVRLGVSGQVISVKFHNTLVEMIVAVAKKIGEQKVVLTGGCFQNRYLIEHAINRLNEEGFKPYWHQRVPTNDGGISLGQIAAQAQSGGISL